MQELDYFSVEGYYGGSQDWMKNLVMYMGGCGAITACDSCLYLAAHGFGGICPTITFTTGQYKGKPLPMLTIDDYVEFAMTMKPYIPPRVNGVRKLVWYIQGFQDYLKDLGQKLSMTAFDGNEPVEAARVRVRTQIDKGLPVPFLLLHHKDRAFKDFNWHWFLLTGYEETKDDFIVRGATYGKPFDLSLNRLWDSGHKDKGGMILYDLPGQNTLRKGGRNDF